MSGATRINFQQVPKVPELLRCFTAPPGHVLLHTDFESVEPKVLATFSQDPTMLELFASGKRHDVYLYVAANILPGMRDKIDAVYNLANPTPESVKAAKKAFPAERALGKPVHLAASYFAGVPKLYQMLRLGGIDVTLEQVAEMHKRYWQLFAGVRRWQRSLEREREDRGGWVYNGHGRPLAIPEHRVKDLVNAHTQSTAHDCLTILLYHLDRLRRERGVTMRPWLVDIHDATIWTAPEDEALDAKRVIKHAYDAMNAELRSPIPITGDVDIGQTFADFKS